MKQVTGRSEFELPISLPIGHVVSVTQSVLDSYLGLPGLQSARATALGDHQFKIELTFSSESFAEAEEIMNEIAGSIGAALNGAATLEMGMTELISA